MGKHKVDLMLMKESLKTHEISHINLLRMVANRKNGQQIPVQSVCRGDCEQRPKQTMALIVCLPLYLSLPPADRDDK